MVGFDEIFWFYFVSVCSGTHGLVILLRGHVKKKSSLRHGINLVSAGLGDQTYWKLESVDEIKTRIKEKTKQNKKNMTKRNQNVKKYVLDQIKFVKWET